MKTIDSHVHARHDTPEEFISHLNRYQYSHICVLGDPGPHKPVRNFPALLAKQAAPDRIFAYGGLAYTPLLTPTPESHEKQLKLLYEAGIDGWKLIESKPSDYKEIGIPLDSDIFERAFAFAEEVDLPLTWHCGDPACFWDPETCPKEAIEHGWDCLGPEYPSLQELYRQVEAVLDRHPRMRVSLAHFYFASDDIEHAKRVLDKYENVKYDLCPGFEEFVNFVKEPEKWHDFFVQYQDRIIYGTDRTDDLADESYGNYDGTYNYFLRALFKNEPVNRDGLNGIGCGLPAEVHDKLFAQNFIDIVGTQPKPIHKKGVEAYADWLMPYLNKEEQKRTENYLQQFI